MIYYLGIQPYHYKQLNNKYKSLYYSVSDSPESDGNNEVIDDDSSENTPVDINLDKSYEKGAKGADGILLKFSKLLEINSDIRGWLKVPGTNIDYPVMQSTGNSEFYLKHDFEGGRDKNQFKNQTPLKKSCNTRTQYGFNRNDVSSVVKI